MLIHQNHLNITAHKKLFIMLALIAALIVPFASYVHYASKIVDVSAVTNAVVEKAESRIGSRYVYGACHTYSQIRNRRQRTFDCSGLVNWTYYQAGASIGINTSSSLRRKGTYVSYRNLRAGDIILFPGHAGVYIGNGKMIHAPNSRSRVKVSRITGYWKRRFRGGRRVIHATSTRTINRSNARAYAMKSSIVSKTYTAGTYKLNLAMTVRKGPGIRYGIAGALSAGKNIKVKKVVNRHWARITYKGKTRYVSLKYSSKVR